MGALPKKKLTRARQGRRLTAYKLKPIHAAICPRCRVAKRPHGACMACGYYRGRQVVDVS